jgi:predicted esterase
MTIEIDSAPTVLELAAWEQGFHTPPLALATMLHRPVVIAHGASDAWAPVTEGRLLAEALTEAGNEPMLMVIPDAGHDLAEADDAALEEFVAAVVERMKPHELPPVLVAIEEMNDGR